MADGYLVKSITQLNLEEWVPNDVEQPGGGAMSGASAEESKWDTALQALPVLEPCPPVARDDNELAILGGSHTWQLSTHFSAAIVLSLLPPDSVLYYIKLRWETKHHNRICPVQTTKDMSPAFPEVLISFYRSTFAK